jgi:hypothetical protein
VRQAGKRNLDFNQVRMVRLRKTICAQCGYSGSGSTGIQEFPSADIWQNVGGSVDTDA